MQQLDKSTIEETYKLFKHFQSGEGSFRYNELDAFRAAMKKIDLDKAMIQTIQQDIKATCDRIKHAKGKNLIWNWMKRSRSNGGSNATGENIL